jgi:predicted dehydrogenase
MAEDRKVRWGVISTANIGMGKVTPGIMKSPHSTVTAIASRDLARAREAADQLGIAKAYGSYDEMLADPEIDAVYNPLPNHLHVDLTLAAAAAGKHVLCEKPIGLDAKDAERLRAVPGGILVAEAFMVRYHPQWLRAREIVRSGELGEVRAVFSLFTYFNTDPADVRNQADIGGGGILDIGCYPVTGGRFIFEDEPKRVVALVDRDPTFRTDRQASVIADFGNGRHLTFLVSTQLVNTQSIELVGTKGRVEIMIPFNAPQDQHTAIIVDKGESLGRNLARREIMPAADQYTEQAEAFALAVLGKQPLLWGIDDAIRSMRVLDAIFASERDGGWAQVT